MKDHLKTSISADDMTAEQLSLDSSEPRFAHTRYGTIQGGSLRNGSSAFLNIPYGKDVPRWSDPQPLDEDYTYSSEPYTKDGLYCFQPDRDFPNKPPKRQLLGLGEPTENPFFADIYIPSTTNLSSQPHTPQKLKRVEVFVHGGFLNFGSTSGQSYNQQFFPTEQYDTVRVLLGYRVSILGFLSSQRCGLDGNYGFKDVWVGLEWVKENISAFGGDPDDIHLEGISGGAHLVHQVLHYAARQARRRAPFRSVTLYSNAILSNPASKAEKEIQFETIVKASNLDLDSANLLHEMRKLPIGTLISAVEKSDPYNIFRGVEGADGWFSPDLMEYQQSGTFAKDLTAVGVEYVVLGDVRDEVAFYGFAFKSENRQEMVPNLERFFSSDDIVRLFSAYPPLHEDAYIHEVNKLQGLVHLPVRLLAKDLAKAGFPIVRYTVEYVAKALGTNGLVMHGSDLCLHQYRLSILSEEEAQMALNLHEAIKEAVQEAVSCRKQRGHEEVLTLSSDGQIGWKEDKRWIELYKLEQVLRA